VFRLPGGEQGTGYICPMGDQRICTLPQ
jgi:hypothetical protein